MTLACACARPELLRIRGGEAFPVNLASCAIFRSWLDGRDIYMPLLHNWCLIIVLIAELITKGEKH